MTTIPGGRLPVTFYESTDQLPDFSDYSMKGRTYRFFDGKPLYPFGYGLSYSTFEYSNLAVLDAAGGKVAISVDIRNTSDVPGDEVAELYAGRADSAPWLAGFRRVHFAPREKRAVKWTVDRADLHGNIIFVAGAQPRDSHGVSTVIDKH